MSFNILMVDDSKVTRMMIKRTIQLTGLPTGTVDEAENGEAGLQKMQANSNYDLIVADINMPVMTGIEMITAMQQNDTLSKTPVVVISTEGSTTRIEELRALGVVGYIRKPFTPESVRDVLKQVLGDWEDETGERTA